MTDKLKESNIDPNPFVASDIISAYHNRAIWSESDKEARPRALSSNKKMENLYRVQQLYYDVIRAMDRQLRAKYGHDDELLLKMKNMLGDRADNKIRSDSQGEMHVQINNKHFYTGSAKEHEKLFKSTKKIFNSVLKEIGQELLDVINNKAKQEEGKPLKNDELIK